MVLHIQIGKSHKGLTLRHGDVEGSSEHNNITKEEVLSEIKDLLEEFDDGHDINCEGSMCHCANRHKKRIPETT